MPVLFLIVVLVRSVPSPARAPVAYSVIRTCEFLVTISCPANCKVCAILMSVCVVWVVF